ncbi:hypothetical protein H7J07_04900 [Mycobacterium koreense]|uniref:Uncharacterized protein n=1 Tax=Mycolicibacillus koreensis TaxID=1069220 RepID=A0A7I7SAQ1_9MYCO|nr:hypothetical protein [Mycolicibacillus koreensis]MCV7247596.1 hypothetical protein [Mycolicibacillus koreensis]OSC32828.1 hypothetical protein B8W67_14000 [Mycolicibacillus koreensis]BBY53974.1 hypothetical protein MKOR_12250 [Mycolicibacillus koreensis]
MSYFRRGDLVELRYDADRGFRHLFEVSSVSSDGTLWLIQRGDAGLSNVRCRVSADEADTAVMSARPETVATYRPAAM